MILRTISSTRRSFRLALAAALLLSVAVVGSSSLNEETAAAAPGGRATRYIPIAPTRVLDTRNAGPLIGDASLSIAPINSVVAAKVAAQGGDVSKIEAVAINLVAVGTFGAGFLTAWPTGEAQSRVSSLNNEGVNDVVPNLAIVPLGAGGNISIFSPTGGDVVIDVQGVFERSTSSSAGRFLPLAVPDRAIDTRDSNPIPAGQSIPVDLTGTGVPATASAAVVNVAVTNTQAAGFLTVWADGVTRPDPAANVNYPTANYTVANNVITGLTNGKMRVFSTAGADVIVDVVGYMTGASAPMGTEGLYVPLVPDRLWDSRPDEFPFNSSNIPPNQTATLPVAGELAIPETGVSAVTMNLTMTNTLAGGFFEAFPAGTTRPEPFSSVNADRANQTVGNHAVVALGPSGGVALYSISGTDFVADITGYFLDETATPPTSPPDPAGDPTPMPDVNPGVIAAPPADQDFEYLLNFGSQLTAPYSRNGIGYYGWNPCNPITYAVNVERATQVQIDAMNVAIRQAEEASGFDFVYLGEVSGSLETSSINDNVPGVGPAMAVIGFSDPYATQVLAGGTIGIGGVRGQLAPDPGTGKGYVVNGGFALADISDVTTVGDITATLTHEIGHMIGLDHVLAFGELMRPSLTNQTFFGNGDKNGLFSIGEPQCPGGAPLDDGTAAAPSLTDAPPQFVSRWVADDRVTHSDRND